MEQEPMQEQGAIRPWLLIVLVIAILGAVGYFGWQYWSQKKLNYSYGDDALVNIPTKTITASPTTTATKSTQAESGPILSVENLKNAYFRINEKEFKLSNGTYNESGENAFNATLDIKNIAYNKKDIDQADEAAVIITTSNGGTGAFKYLIVMGIKGGQPQHISDVLIEDRAIIKNISISENEISVEATIHGPSDPSCCPTLDKTLRYQLTDSSKLIKI